MNTLPTAREKFDQMVNDERAKLHKASREDGYERACPRWEKETGLAPPFRTFRSYTEWRLRRAHTETRGNIHLKG